MKWFKHNSSASHEVPVRNVFESYGYYGLGVFWCIMEKVVMYDGLITVAELEKEFCSKHFSRVKVRSLIQDFAVFEVNGLGQVCVSSDIPTIKTVDSVPEIPSDVSAAIPAYDPVNVPVDTPSDIPMDVPVDIPVDVPLDTPPVNPSYTPACKEEKRKDKKKRDTPPQSVEDVEWESGFRAHYPTLSRMEKPLTMAEYRKLLQKYSIDRIRSKLISMENRPGVEKKYKSVYLTLLKWLGD